jgi:aldose 1-epimerase
MQKEIFGHMPDGTPIDLYRLKTEFLEAAFTTYGAGILSLSAPDRFGHREDIVLGFATLDEYLHNHFSTSPIFFGSTIGRYANRIAQARFTLEQKEYQLPKNNGHHTLHGGLGGFHNVVWDASPIPNGVAFHYVSADGEQGFPGQLETTVRYTLAGSDWKIEYEATTNKTTVLNLTNHAYFNLFGAETGKFILSHRLRIPASRFTPADAESIPTGEVRSVAGSPLDFRDSTAIGDRISAPDEQLQLAKGYDHNFILDDSSPQLKPAAELYEPAIGRVLEVLTTEPAIQLYTGNYLDGSARGKSGQPYYKRAGLCLETQHFPDSPHHPDFPSTVLRPGEKFQSTTIYRFSTR